MINDIVYLRQQAERCRRLAAGCGDARTAQALRLMAEDYEARVAQADMAQADAPIEFMLVTPQQA